MSGDLAFFEIGVEDTARGRAFYEGLFGWTFEQGPSGGGFGILTDKVAVLREQGNVPIFPAERAEYESWHAAVRAKHTDADFDRLR